MAELSNVWPLSPQPYLFPGHNIVMAHFPFRITLHSLENGREECSLPIELPSQSSPPWITDLFWLKKERKTNKNQMPEMFKRGNVIVSNYDNKSDILPGLIPCSEYTDRFCSFNPPHPAITRSFTGWHTTAKVRATFIETDWSEL